MRIGDCVGTDEGLVGRAEDVRVVGKYAVNARTPQTFASFHTIDCIHKYLKPLPDNRLNKCMVRQRVGDVQRPGTKCTRQIEGIRVVSAQQQAERYVIHAGLNFFAKGFEFRNEKR